MEKILLVEDNEHIMDINARYLAAMGYSVEKAYSAKQAETVFRESMPDLVVLDIMLPDGDGIS
ncbi:MAG: response regulator, partial [Firmicutes bacterium]|nr:response regulator [Bacillota bacterium]